MDKHTIYKTIRQPSTEELLRGEDPQTHFSRACKELEVKIIYALSPQAKGRSERSFRTFQDRLIKEMRLEGIRTMQEANEFLKRCLPILNKRFGKESLKRADLYRPLPREIKLLKTPKLMHLVGRKMK